MSLDKEKIVETLLILVPELNEVLVYLEKNEGWINLDERFISLLLQWELNWQEYYEDEQRLRALSSLMFFDVEELKEFKKNNDYETALLELITLNKEVDDFDFDDLGTADELAEIYNEQSDEDKNKELKQFVILCLGIITSSFNYLALMLHGYTMCTLVAMAKDGDDNAFCKAVHIDRTVLNLPYFKQRMLKAQFGNDQNFLNILAYQLKNPLHKGKIKYKILWLTFLILDDEGLLDSLSHEEIFDICEQTGVYGKEHGIEDVGHISKRLRDFRKYQGKSKIF